jgi:hypothetical protein
VSYDEGKTWTHAYRYRTGGSGYSDLVVTQDNDVGILFEHASGGLNGIYFIEANLEKLTNEKDAYIKAAGVKLLLDGAGPNDASATQEHHDGYDAHDGDFTMLTSFKLDASASLHDTQFIIRKGNRVSDDYGWSIFIEDNKIKFRARTRHKTGGKVGVEASLGNHLTDRTKKHTLAAQFVRSGGSHEMRLFLNGDQLKTTSLYEPLKAGAEIATKEKLIFAGADASPLKGEVYGLWTYRFALPLSVISAYSISMNKDYDYQVHYENRDFDISP